MPKQLIIHADDAGLSHAHNAATLKAMEEGICNSYSIMMPCAWAYEMVKMARDHPNHDAGIHLTLTCEWHTYRFGPVAGRRAVPSLVDDKGHFYKKRDQLAKHARPEEVETELRAQIDYALSLGLEPTHLDSHMFSVGSRPEFFEIYRKLGREFHLPVLLNHELFAYVGNQFPTFKIDANEVLVNHAHFADFDMFQQGSMEEYYHSVLRGLPDGLNILLLHPAFDTPEMKAVTIDHPNFGSAWREIDYKFLTSKAGRTLLVESDIELVTWRYINPFLQ